MSLIEYGWNDHWERLFREENVPEGRPARVVAEHRGSFRVHDGGEELSARPAGRLLHAASGRGDLPAVGDWAVIEGGGSGDAVIQAVLPRFSKFSRKAAGTRTEEQVVAANVDTIWIVSAFGYDYNPARIDRYRVMVRGGGAEPVAVLTKADLAGDADGDAEELRLRLGETPVHVVSAIRGDGLEELAERLLPGRTVALLGSSGAGKSTLLNRLAGREVMATSDLRKGIEKGRHKTTHRQLVLLPSGALLLDTPGMRELQLWGTEEEIAAGFDDIEELSAECRYRDCRHETEPGCAVRAAVDEGVLAEERLADFLKLRKEAAHFERKSDARAAIEGKRKAKWIAKEIRRHYKERD